MHVIFVSSDLCPQLNNIFTKKKEVSETCINFEKKWSVEHITR